MAQASAEKLEHTGPAEKERVASVPHRKQLARTPEPPLPKKEQSRLSIVSDGVVGESQCERAAPWRDNRGLEREHGKEEVDTTEKSMSG